METTASSMPIHIRAGNLRTSIAIESWIHRKLRGVLRRFSTQMTAIKVHLGDMNGPKRGRSHMSCRMEAHVHNQRPVVVRARASDLYTAIDIASRKLESALATMVKPGDSRARRNGRAPRQRGSHVVSSAEHAGRVHTSTQTPGRQTPRAEADEPQGRVIIAGYGPVGRALADELVKLRVPFAVVDTNPGTARTLQSLDVPVLCGDATDPEVLRAIGVATAAAIAITIPDSEEAVRACAAARSLAPAVHIAVRTTFLSQGLSAIRAGANSITVEEIATAEAMARDVSLHIAGGRVNRA